MIFNQEVADPHTYAYILATIETNKTSKMTTKRKNPITSILAHESVKESKTAMYVKIVAGLEKLRAGGNFDEIALASNLEPAQVWKRLSEMERLGLLFNTGITHPAKSGRSASVWQLTSLKPTLSTTIKITKNGGNSVVQCDLFGNV